MTPTEVTVVARYRVRPGCGDRVAGLLASHAAETTAEPGCLEFIAYRARDEPDRFLLYERYRDEQAFQDHRASAHFRHNIEQHVAPLLLERAWERLDPV